MINILLIVRDDQIPECLREPLATPDIRTVTRRSPDEAATALDRSVFDAVIVYADADLPVLKEQLQALRQSRDIFILVVAPEYSLEMETAAIETGADLYFAEPLPRHSVQRILRQSGQKSGMEITPARRTPAPPPQQQGSPAAHSTLQILRDFSHVLGFSLDYKAFTQHFILKLRDHIRFSRIGIFLEPMSKQMVVRKESSQYLECVASLGLPSDLIDCFQLSRDIGIGHTLTERPRVLNLSRMEPELSDYEHRTITKEFKILGCELAIPLSDREKVIGVALINKPVSNRDYTEDEVELLYLLMEELGIAIRNSRLHHELANHGQLIEDVLGSMLSGAIVVSENLQILYANAAAAQFLDRRPGDGSRHAPNFADLPARLAGAVHKAVEKGEICDPFFTQGPSEGEVYRASLVPFAHKGELTLLPRPIMVVLEDFTKIEANKQSALADSRNELISLIAERFAHEIRNSLVPLSTHAQLIDKRIEDPKFQKSLKSSLLKESARIKRFSEQMLYLAQHSAGADADLDIADLIQSAFKKAKQQLVAPGAKLEIDENAMNGPVQGNPEALAYAFEELFINAIQAHPEKPVVHLDIQKSEEGIFRIRMRDEGTGFSDETLDHATEPFFTTRNTGVGLGLSVAQKVFREHHGFLRLFRRTPELNWDLEIELPEILSTAKNETNDHSDLPRI
ncbi:ATP-binding protein [Coraliomargarita parva]|uniref:ATP-binding protein n=1 Tax=Coraliomargarita parva TaxID=3014050 RepID=UPI0022B2C409|nr:ATP-binding protein [Coraliomargarita parva]